VDKPPSPSAGKTFPETPNPPASKDINVPTGATSNPTSQSAADSRCDAAHQFQGQTPPCIKKHPQYALCPLDSGPMVDHNQVKAHLCQGLRKYRDNIRVLYSPCGTIRTWSICISVHEYPSRTGTNQGPLLQHEDYLQAHRCKFLCSPLPSYLEI
jgi:hypothetical protein